jgi:hypothetical protein
MNLGVNLRKELRLISLMQYIMMDITVLHVENIISATHWIVTGKKRIKNVDKLYQIIYTILAGK